MAHKLLLKKVSKLCQVSIYRTIVVKKQVV